MKFSTAGLVAGALSSVALFGGVTATASAAPVTSTLRIEGSQTTLFEGPVTTDTRTLDGHDGTGTHPCGTTPTAGGLLGTAAEQAPFGFKATYYASASDFFLDEVQQDRPDYNQTQTYWSLFDDGTATSTGMCGTALKGGEEILFAVTDGNGPVLGLAAPNRAAPGSTVELTVTDKGNGNPVAGATVGGQTTDASGKARVVVAQRGANDYKATKAGAIRSNRASVCATDGQDGFCGTSTPGAPVGQQAAPAPRRDSARPVGRVVGLSDRQAFTRARAPRTLRIAAADPSGIAQVKLRLTRRSAGRCSYLSGSRDAFRAAKCGRAFAFKASDQGTFSYLLPERLTPGRYVLDVIAIDKAFNRDLPARGRNRIVFTVR
jgi:predicted RNA-binding protein YlxR (DUF448 family)